MHIAICDEIIADRKQLERLMKRESDKQVATRGILYADSFGSPQALLQNPRQYDGFYIDICESREFSIAELIEKLRSLGVVAPIVLCCSKIDYRSLNLPEDILYLDKPIQVEELEKSLNHVWELVLSAPSLIEIRLEDDTAYVEPSRIRYAVSKGGINTITLTDNRRLETKGFLDNYLAEWEGFDTFVELGPWVIINIAHIKDFRFGKIVMDDDTVFRASPLLISQLKKIVS